MELKDYEINDEELENVNGGVFIYKGYVTNKDNGKKYELLVSEELAMNLVTQMGVTTEDSRIEALIQANYISSTPVN